MGEKLLFHDTGHISVFGVGFDWGRARERVKWRIRARAVDQSRVVIFFRRGLQGCLFRHPQSGVKTADLLKSTAATVQISVFRYILLSRRKIKGDAVSPRDSN